MAVSTGKKARKAAATAPAQEYQVAKFKEIHPLNYIQETYMDAIEDNSIIFGIGSAGTGKTFISATYAAQELYYKRIRKVIVTRPNVESARSLGHLPGELEEKYAPYLEPFEAVFRKSLGVGFYEYCLKEKMIEPKPLGFMRGVTFEDCVVLVDEAQNITKSEFKMLLSRIGRNCKVILSGDPKQVDIKDSGLEDAVRRLEHIDDVEAVRFLDSDIVRSKLCKEIILAYND